MADQRRVRTPRSNSTLAASRKPARTASLKPILRTIQDKSDVMPDDKAAEADGTEAFWGHYVEDRLRHFSQDYS